MIYQPNSLKRCSKCLNWFPITPKYFYRRGGKRNDLQSICKTCQTIQSNENYHKSPLRQEKARNYAHNYRLNHKKQIRAYLKNWRVRRADYNRALKRKYVEKNRIRVNRAWHIREAKKKKLAATFTAADWQFALNYFHGCCAVCGRPPGFWHTIAQDHWIPLSKNGAYNPENILPLCDGIDGCNQSKSNRDAREWLVEKFGLHKATKILARINKYFEQIKGDHQ